MNSYKIKLLDRTKLINFWSFSGNDLKKNFPKNNKFIFYFYKNKNLFDFNVFILTIKKIFPVLNSIFLNKGKFLFAGTTQAYCHNINKNNFVSDTKDTTVGILTNFSLKGYKNIKLLNLKKIPSIVFLLHSEKNFLFLESKNRCIPVVGLVDSSSTTLIEYPIFLNSFYFYNIYIFSRFFFKYITRLI
jgi:ribosomal protein S2